MSTTPELKPCPFCGGKAWFTENPQMTGPMEWYAGCRACDYGFGALSVEETVRLWNRRASLSERDVPTFGYEDVGSIQREAERRIPSMDAATFEPELPEGLREKVKAVGTDNMSNAELGALCKTLSARTVGRVASILSAALISAGQRLSGDAAPPRDTEAKHET